ncbi:hypothetical protein, partial [Enterococcus faecium]
LQTSLVFFAQQTLETAAEKSARQILTGAAQKAGTDVTAFKTLACSKLPDFMAKNCAANLVVNVTTVTSFSNANTSPPALTYDANGN